MSRLKRKSIELESIKLKVNALIFRFESHSCRKIFVLFSLKKTIARLFFEKREISFSFVNSLNRFSSKFNIDFFRLKQILRFFFFFKVFHLYIQLILDLHNF